MQHEQPWTPERFVQHTFTTTRFGPGYDQDEVDNLLDRCVAQLRAYASGSATVVQPSAAEPEQPGPVAAHGGWFARWAARIGGAMAGTGADSRPIHSSEVAAHRFTETRMRDGYDPAEVDEVLDRMAAMLEAHERGGAAPA